MATKNISYKNEYLLIKHYPELITQGQALTPINYSKNQILFNNNEKFIENKILDKKNISEEELDHPFPLESDFEVKEDIKKDIIIKEIKEYQIKNKKNKEKIRDKYIDFINIIKNAKVTQNNNKKEQKAKRINLNQINNILFKNRSKKKIIEENKNNISEVKPGNKLNQKAQNPFKGNKLKKMNYLNPKIISKKIISDEYKKKSTSFFLNKKLNFNHFIKKRVITNTNNKPQKKDKDVNLKKNHKYTPNLFEKDFPDKKPLNTITQSNDNKRAYMHSTIIKSCDLSSNNNRSCTIPYFSRKTQKYYLLSQNNKNSSNITATEADSKKELNNNIKNIILTLNNSNRRILKHTYSKGGKFNNIQTTYIISTSKSKSINLNKDEKNTILNRNSKAHYRRRNSPLNEHNKNNNICDSFGTKTSNRNNETMNSSNISNIHISEKNSNKNSLKYYQYNKLRAYFSVQRNKYYDSIYNYDYNARNNNNNNLTKSIVQTSFQLYNENSFYNKDTYNNVLDNNRYWNLPIYDNYKSSNTNSYNNLYNF